MANLSILNRTFLLAGFAGLFSVASVAHGQTGKAPSPANWDKLRDPARKFARSLLKSK